MDACLKLWQLIRARVLTVPRFDLFLQGSLLITILLEHNVYLLLNRDADTGYSTPLIEDWVMMGSGGAEFLLGALLAWWGRGKRNFALAGWLAATAVSGLIVLAFPFKRPNLPSVDLCGGDPILPMSNYVEDPDSMATPRTVFLIITAVMCALTQVSIWAHGLTYLDDHEPQSGPYFFGILISIRLSLGLSGQNWLRPGAVRDDWWVAQLTLPMLTLMFSGLFSLFPTRMKTDSTVLVDDDFNDDGFFASLGRVCTNKVLILQVGALGFINAGLFGFFHYDRDFIEARYHIEARREDLRSARLVASIFRPLVIIFFVMIFRVRFSVRRSDGVKANTAARVGGVVAIFVAIFFTVVAFIDCSVGDIAGLQNGVFEQPGCSSECGCDSERYGFAPVCDLHTTSTYFSPCHAGCSQYDDLNGFLVFNNCTCSPEPDTAGALGRMVRGACALPGCQLVYSLYQVFMTVILAIAGASILMQGMVFLRAVERRDKPVAVGVMLGVVALLAHVLGHLLYMLISYLTCAFSSDGRCVLHRPIVYSMALVSAGMALCSALVSITASRLANRHATKDDDDNNVNFR